ncbi:hypothetical protein JCM21142_93727 [Saccharicrinis fermentans DSM 9555 = JCM 21142]|uniref:Uncharacterized protein n=1 Tax=Saccharicrinis fermentans DSM 9555 = JCM 21142 TaxID=869213 RepID=W7YRB6_9BACT|nr:hypothetical protein JCM21142_93727 [Saccharicrinis fermentans DSM 9555 = JCM 21142]
MIVYNFILKSIFYYADILYTTSKSSKNNLLNLIKTRTNPFVLTSLSIAFF